MKRIPHTHTLQGFFNELTPEALRLFSDRLQMLVQNSSKHFSLNLPSEPRSQIEVSFTVSFREETVQSDSYAPSVLDEFRQEMQPY
jgi:hypothetical protein